MALTLDGTGTIGGLSTGGLPDGSIAQADLAAGVAGVGPAFSAYGTAFQSLANATLTKIQYNTEEFDTNSNYDPTTNYRFTPTVAGYYQINAIITSAGSATGLIGPVLYKNGSSFKDGNFLTNSTSGPEAILSCLVYANGSTDYFEIYGYQSSGGALNTGSWDSTLSFSGCLVRSA